MKPKKDRRNLLQHHLVLGILGRIRGVCVLCDSFFFLSFSFLFFPTFLDSAGMGFLVHVSLLLSLSCTYVGSVQVNH